MTTVKDFIKRHPVPLYFILSFVISWSAILVLTGPDGLPATVDQIMVLGVAALLGPSVAGILMTGLASGWEGLRELVSRLLRWRVGARWYGVALLTAPLVTTAVLLALSLFSPEFLPGIFTSDDKATLLLTGIAAGFVVGLFEELGWTGFAIPRMRLRYSVLATGLIVGFLWGAWHFLLFWESDSFSGAFPLALLLARLFFWLPAYRVLMVWVYDHTESLLVAILMHTSLVATLMIVEPPLTGGGLLIFILGRGAVLWVLVAAVTMTDTKPATVVKAVRLRYAVPFVLLLVAVYWMSIHPWMTNWGSTAEERQMALPGDDLSPDRAGQSTLALTINARPEVIWQWLVQVGQDRAGFYSYTWLENLLGSDIHNADEIHPEWQQLAVGDAWRLVSPDYLGGLGKEAASPVLISEPNRALVLDMFGAHVIEPIDEQSSRLLVRGQSGPGNLMTKLVMDPLVFTMERRMLLGLKARAEGLPDAPAPLMAIAHLGWAAAGVTVAGLFLSQRRRRYWLALPVLAALPALLMAGDVQAALAAFLAVGIPVLGFLIYGRSWLGPLLVIGAIVMLTLLLAPEAYVAIGLAFALLLLAALGATIAARSRIARGAALRTEG